MAVRNYGKDLQGIVDEKFTLGAVTGVAVNNNYVWTGTKGIQVQSISTSTMNDYGRTGINRYGAVEDLDNTVQDMTLEQDRAFTFAIDKMDADETQGALQATAALERQLREVVIPEIDKYRLTAMATGAGTKKVETAAADKTTAYEMVAQANVILTENKVPEAGRIIYVTPSFAALLRRDESFLPGTEIGAGVKITGMIGQVEGFAVVVVPSSYLPAKAHFIATHQAATVSPVKLAEYKIHEDAPGISGSLVEGRVYYDAFVLENKKMAIYSSVAP